MARPKRRMIDPAIWVDPDLGALSPAHRLLFIGTFSLADDEGRLKADPRLLKAQVFPYDDLTPDQVDQLVIDLDQAGLIDHYEINGHIYISHPNWSKHQQIRQDRLVPSDIPPPPCGISRTNDNQPPQNAAQGSLREGKLREGSLPLPHPPVGAQGCADQEETGGEISGEILGGEKQEPEAGAGNGQPVQRVAIRFAKPPASDTRANLRNAGYVYDSTTQTWTAPATPRARELAERYRPYLATDAPTVAPAATAAATTPPVSPLATGAQGEAPAAPALPPTPAHLQPVLDWLRDHMRPQSFRTWFAPTALAGDAERVEVLTISPIIANHIRDCHLDLLRQAFEATLGRQPAAVEIQAPTTDPARASPPGGPPASDHTPTRSTS